jgi:co-chaperonin GroES (HSP10)
MKFLGKLVIIERPHLEDKPSGIELGPEAKKQLENELIKKFSELPVTFVGADVEKVKVGDKVLITPKQLSYCDTFEKDDKIYYVAKESDVIAIY